MEKVFKMNGYQEKQFNMVVLKARRRPHIRNEEKEEG
jgi:hypothetical protein